MTLAPYPAEAGYATWRPRGRLCELGRPVTLEEPPARVGAEGVLTLLHAFAVRVYGVGPLWDGLITVRQKVPVGDYKRGVIQTVTDTDPEHDALVVPAGTPEKRILVCAHWDLGAPWRVDVIGWVRGREPGARVPFAELRSFDSILLAEDLEREL